jgi:hypothetical protein
MVQVKHIIEDVFLDELTNTLGHRPHLIMSQQTAKRSLHHNLYQNGISVAADSFLLYNHDIINHKLYDPLSINFDFMGYHDYGKIQVNVIKGVYDYHKINSEGLLTYQVNGMRIITEIRIYSYERKVKEFNSTDVIQHNVFLDNLLAFVLDDESVYYFHDSGDYGRPAVLFFYCQSVSVLDEFCETKKGNLGDKLHNLRILLK